MATAEILISRRSASVESGKVKVELLQCEHFFTQHDV